MGVKVYIVAATLSATAIAAAAYVYHHQTKRRKPKVRQLTEEELEKATWKPVGKLTKIYLYPVKSCGPLELSSSETALGGLRYEDKSLVHEPILDRSYMVIMASKKTFVTGRMCPQLVLIKPKFTCEGIQLHFGNKEPLLLDGQYKDNDIIHTNVFGSQVTGFDCGNAAADWFSAILSRSVRLIYATGDTTRHPQTELTIDTPLLKPELDGPLFADGNSYMGLGEESCKDLSLRTPQIPSPLRFRPNLVFSNKEDCDDLEPYAEDNWTYIKIGESCIMRHVYPCARCVFTNVNPVTGTKDVIQNTLDCLQMYRRLYEKAGPVFGVNFGLEKSAPIKVGDTIYTIQEDIFCTQD